jgi:uncharacterized protein YndB with AHSA1/START domain
MNTAPSIVPAAAGAVSVRKAVTVAAPIDIAFEVFTTRLEAWWPMATHHIGEASCAAVVIEPRVGGRWFERGADGSECRWGHVRLWQPPSRVVLAWQLSAQWTYDPALLTEVDVRFQALDKHTTRVELEHRGLEAFGAQALAMQSTFASPSGWGGILETYAQVAAGRS